MAYKNKTLLEFIEETGSANPTPGGGSIAALTAATSAALIEMVANLTINKSGYEAVQEEIKLVQQQAKFLSHDFLDLIEADCQGFTTFMEALRLPKNTDEEKAARQAILQQAYRTAAEVPFKIGFLANQLFDMAEIVIEKGNKNAVTDGLMAVLNARCAIRSAFLNVKINLGGIKDEGYVLNLEKDMQKIEEQLERKETELLHKASL